MSETESKDSVSMSAPTASPGELLSRQREQLGVPLTDAARALNLRPAVVEGLERDQYDEIPVATYRRGYLRSYAKYLGMDEQQVLEAYKALNGSSDSERKVTPVSVSRPPSKAGAWLFKLVTLLVIAGLIALTVMWWQSRGGSEPPSMGTAPSMEEDGDLSGSAESQPAASESPAQATSDDDSQADATPASGQGTSAQSTSQRGTSQQGTSEQGASETTQTPSDEAVDAAADLTRTEPDADAQQEEAESDTVATSADSNPNLLELTFNEQSWTEIFDANNQRVFVGLQTPGTTASVEGEPPFRLTVGNATGVELIYQGETIDLGERAGANNVARFSLGE